MAQAQITTSTGNQRNRSWEGRTTSEMMMTSKRSVLGHTTPTTLRVSWRCIVWSHQSRHLRRSAQHEKKKREEKSEKGLFTVTREPRAGQASDLRVRDDDVRARTVVSSKKILQNRYCSTFICLWQILSNYGLTRLKRFISSIPTKLCN